MGNSRVAYATFYLYKGEKNMSDIRPTSMKRITNKKFAQAFINEQVKAI